MKILTITHKNINYEFRLLESVRVIEIFKDGLFTYSMEWTGRLFVCDCPGAKWHHKCWHVRMAEMFEMVESISEPWCQWAEEGGKMKYGTRQI